MKDMEQLRLRIDKIDSQLVSLLNQRATVALELGTAKLKQGLPIRNQQREAAVIEKVTQLNQGPLAKSALTSIYTAIIKACRQLQQ